MPEVSFRLAALRDLDRIVTRIAEDDPQAAFRFQENVLRRIALLRVVPESAQPRPGLGTDIRTLPIGRYVVLLRVRSRQVTVLRILHGARDLPRIVKP